MDEDGENRQPPDSLFSTTDFRLKKKQKLSRLRLEAAAPLRPLEGDTTQVMRACAHKRLIYTYLIG